MSPPPLKTEFKLLIWNIKKKKNYWSKFNDLNFLKDAKDVLQNPIISIHENLWHKIAIVCSLFGFNI